MGPQNIPLPKTYTSVHKLAATGMLKALRALLDPEGAKAAADGLVPAFGTRTPKVAEASQAKAAAEAAAAEAEAAAAEAKAQASPRAAGALVDSFLPDELLAGMGGGKEEEEEDTGPSFSMASPRAGGGGTGAGDFSAQDSLPAPGDIDVNAVDATGLTPLMHAARNGHGDITTFLIDFNAGEVELDRPSPSSGTTALGLAAAAGCEEPVRLLLAAGADVGILDMHDNSALHQACVGGNLPIIQALLAAGAAVNGQNRAGHTPLMILAANGHATAARDGLLKSCVGGISLGGSGGAPSPKRGGGAPPGGSATPTPTPTADVALVDDRGFTALHHAAAQGHVRMVKLLLSVGCSPAVRAVGPEGAGSGPTPLDVAASQEVQALLTGSSPASESKK